MTIHQLNIIAVFDNEQVAQQVSNYLTSNINFTDLQVAQRMTPPVVTQVKLDSEYTLTAKLWFRSGKKAVRDNLINKAKTRVKQSGIIDHIIYARIDKHLCTHDSTNEACVTEEVLIWP